MLQQEEPFININVEMIEGRQFIRCADCNTPRPVFDNVKTPDKLANRIRTLNIRINHVKRLLPHRPDVIQDDLKELAMLEHEVREEEKTQILRAVPLYRSPTDKNKLVCGDCFDNLYNFSYNAHGERKINQV